mmetsp:Transcript_23793/g.71480  ORF Transcript_23793/g.71480 Transcript_23793/m.71480 type:complete len:224 (-) Transcript_23793:595-1266(-)
MASKRLISLSTMSRSLACSSFNFSRTSDLRRTCSARSWYTSSIKARRASSSFSHAAYRFAHCRSDSSFCNLMSSSSLSAFLAISSFRASVNSMAFFLAFVFSASSLSAMILSRSRTPLMKFLSNSLSNRSSSAFWACWISMYSSAFFRSSFANTRSRMMASFSSAAWAAHSFFISPTSAASCSSSAWTFSFFISSCTARVLVCWSFRSRLSSFSRSSRSILAR